MKPGAIGPSEGRGSPIPVRPPRYALGVPKILHTADWQLGMTRRFLAPEAQARFTQARIDAIGAIGAMAEAEGCVAVVVGGDVFETNQVGRQVVVRALAAMGSCGVPFHLLPGNHDPHDASSVYSSPTFVEHCPPNVSVLDRAGVHEVAPGLELVAAPFTSKRPVTDLVGAAVDLLPAGPAPDGTVRVVVGHGAVDSVFPDLDNPAIIHGAALDAALAERRIHYVALGDRHSTTTCGPSGRVWYAGAPEPTDFDEVDPGNVLVVDVEPGGCHVQRRPLGSWRFAREKFHVNGVEDVADLDAWLRAHPSPDRTIVRLDLVGAMPIRAHARLQEVLGYHGELFAAIDQLDQHTDLVVLPDDADFADLDLTGFARQALDDLRAEVGFGGADAAVAADALALLYRFARSRP